MSAEPTGSEPSTKQDVRAPDLAGLSAFVAKVLDQLSLSAWLPGALFAVSVTVLANFADHGDVDLPRVISDVSGNWVTVLVWAVPVLVISVLVIQASSFAAIQFLEGYGAARGPGRWIRSGLIQWQTSVLNRLERRMRKAKRRAFDGSVDKWADQPTEVVMALRATAYGLDVPSLSEAHKDAYDNLDWRSECAAWRLARIAEMEDRCKECPARHRVLPTRLGNVLRATEDELDNAGEDVSDFALRRRALVPARVQLQHDQFRSRLDLYATLTVVNALLVVLSVVLLRWGDVEWQRIAIVAVGFVAFTDISYRASVASARGYCTILTVMDKTAT